MGKSGVFRGVVAMESRIRKAIRSWPKGGACGVGGSG